MLDKKDSFGFLLSRLWFHIRPKRKKQFLILLLLIFLTSIAEILSLGALFPFLSVLTSPEKVMDSHYFKYLNKIIHISSQRELIVFLTLFFVIAILFAAFMRLTLLWVKTRLAHAVGAEFSTGLYKIALYQPYKVHLKRNSSEVISIISGKSKSLINSTILPILNLASSGVILFAILLTLLQIEPLISIMSVFCFGTIYLIIILSSRSRLAIYSKNISVKQVQVLKALQEGLGGIRDVLIDGTQKMYCKIYSDADATLRRSQANIEIISNSPRFVVEALGMILIAVLAYTLAIRDEGISSAIPILGTMALAAQQLLPVIQQMFSSWALLKGGKASLTDTLMMLDQQVSSDSGSNSKEKIDFSSSITLRNVSFSYDENGEFVLRNINLNVIRGARIGFIGSTGCGKSTLLDIFMGLIEPNEGDYFVDNVKINNTNIRSLQKIISHVPQSIYLSDSTLKENIAFGVPLEQINMSQVYAAAKKAQIADTIENLENKYDTIIGERGIRLSGGQRQRIGIARALYKNSQIIIFDEATSALDNDTEQVVMDSIENLDENLTILIVAHRLTTLKNCTEIIQLENGVIKSRGKYNEIINH